MTELEPHQDDEFAQQVAEEKRSAELLTLLAFLLELKLTLYGYQQATKENNNLWLAIFAGMTIFSLGITHILYKDHVSTS